jgi:hypothetical protein
MVDFDHVVRRVDSAVGLTAPLGCSASGKDRFELALFACRGVGSAREAGDFSRTLQSFQAVVRNSKNSDIYLIRRADGGGAIHTATQKLISKGRARRQLPLLPRKNSEIRHKLFFSRPVVLRRNRAYIWHRNMTSGSSEE